MRACDYFVEYAKIHTTSDEKSGLHPSFPGEFNLAKVLEKQLRAFGLENVRLDERCYVYGFLPASDGCENSVPIGFISHMDTSPEACGENVNPIFTPNYDGSVIELKNGHKLNPAKFPFLETFKGETLIHTDGTTLLGADDKAGIAEIMRMLERLTTENIKHGPVWIAFTPDEEIGEGTDNFDLVDYGAKYAYTVDGGDVNCIECENFNAASACVKVTGVSVHPGDAKNIMVNASNVAMEFHALLPACERPEHTSGREGFYHLTEMSGCVSSAELHYIVRDHDRAKFEQRKSFMKSAANLINKKYGPGTLKLTIKDSYYNMLEKIQPHMHLVDTAWKAIEKNNMTPEIVPIRGGTDGARLSFEGLPCPNLGTGGYNFHGEMELISVERMERASNVLVDIIKAYSTV